MKLASLSLGLLTWTLGPSVSAQTPSACIPPPGGLCLSADEVQILRDAAQELHDLHEAPARIEILDPVIVIRDWNGRVYVNGGDIRPLRMKLKIGSTVERDMEVVLPSIIQYRPAPLEPMFRLRIRAEAGVLVRGSIDLARSKDSSSWPIDAGIGWDFFHLDILNASVHTGIFSSGAGIGLDLTHNFGIYTGFSLVYRGWTPDSLLALYFAF